MAIYVTGDTHGEFSRFHRSRFPQQAELTKDDYVIICGDFGGIWEGENKNPFEKEMLDVLEEKPFTVLFCDGNHENFETLNAYKKKKWNGGYVHEIRPHVLHLMRGQIFNIDGYRILSMGGAASHDIKDGIIVIDLKDKEQKWRKIASQYHKEGKQFRIKDITWWQEENITEEDYQEAVRNLDKVNWKVDFVISHCCPSSTLALLSGGAYKPDNNTGYLEKIREKLNYRRWYFGHYHQDVNVNYNEILIYEKIEQIG